MRQRYLVSYTEIGQIGPNVQLTKSMTKKEIGMNYISHACAIMLGAVIATPAHSALTVFTDRAAWQSAAGGVGNLFENFDSYMDDVLYGPAPVVAGFLTLSVVDGVQDGSWRIDAPPTQFGTIPGVNTSTFITTLGVGAGGFGDTLLSFAPVRGLGFDYSGASYSTVAGILSTNLGDSITVAISGNADKSFIGLLYTGGETFTSLKWNEDSTLSVSFPAFGAGIDNVEAFSPVPLPGAYWMLSSALLGLAAAARRRRD